MYTLTVQTTIGGTVMQPGIGTFTFPAGTEVTISAVPEPVGYKFGNWQGDTGTVASVNTASTTITMNGDYTIKAKFNYQPSVTLTIIIVGNGTVTHPGSGTFSYDVGTVVNLLAMPGSGASFLGWTGSVGQVANPDAADTTVTMNGNVTITANFSP